MTTSHEPNEYGFAGAGTMPDAEPETDRPDTRDVAEDVAVPGDDLTGSVGDGLADLSTDDDAGEAAAER